MVKWRLLSGICITAVFIALLWLDFRIGSPQGLERPGLLLAVPFLVLVTVAAAELCRWWRGADDAPHAVVVQLGVLLVAGASCVPLATGRLLDPGPLGMVALPAAGLCAAVGVMFLWEMVQFRDRGTVTPRLGRTLLAVCYIGVLASPLPLLRILYDNSWGMIAILSLVIPVKLSDTAAYFVGHWLGRDKLAPHISPGKTVQGAAGALVGGSLGALLVFFVIAPLFGVSAAGSVPAVLVFGLAVTLAGMLGDLAESLLKRDAGRKDSSQLVPGLGGVLDVIDSILGAAPVALALWVVGLVGPRLELNGI